MNRHSKRTPIKWTRRRSRPIKGWEPGHSPMQYGRSAHLGDGIMAHEGYSYIACECGKTYSGKGEAGGQASHRRHIGRLKFVHSHDEGKPCNSKCRPQAEFKAQQREARADA